MGSLHAHLQGSGSAARARLRVGAAAVGAFTLAALVALAAALPNRLFGGVGGSFLDDASVLALWFAGCTLFVLPFEFVGGVLVPRAFGRKWPSAEEWFLRWLRGALVTLVALSFACAAIVVAGRYGGRAGATGMVGLLAAALLAGQEWLATLVGNLTRSAVGTDGLEEEIQSLGLVVPPLRVLESREDTFTGGVVGLPTAERILLPLTWIGRLEPNEVALLVARRTQAVERGLRALGLAGALSTLLVTFALASLLPGAGVGDVAGFLTTSLWFSVLTAAVMVALMAPSRAATLAADAYALDASADAEGVLTRAITTVDELGHRAWRRDDRLEQLLDPVPGAGARRAALTNPKRENAPWHVAQAAILFASVAGSPLARLAPWSIGRPDLWVLPPTDG